MIKEENGYTKSALGSSYFIFVLRAIPEITMARVVGGHLGHLRDAFG
jgi:hypothetical protein